MSLILNLEAENIKYLNCGYHSKIFKIKNDMVRKITEYDDDNLLTSSTLVEIDILRMLGYHKNIVTFYGIDYGSDSIYIYLEEMESDVRRWVTNVDYNYRMMLLPNFIYDMYNGLNYLHQNKIIHNNFTPSNILIKNKTFKICDFGLSGNIYRIYQQDKIRRGQLYYRAPESLLSIINIPTNDLFKLDDWSFGLVILYYIFQKDILIGNDEDKMLRKIIKYTDKSDDLNIENFIDMIKITDDNLDIEKIMNDKFNKNLKNLLKKMLKINFLRRNYENEIHIYLNNDKDVFINQNIYIDECNFKNDENIYMLINNWNYDSFILSVIYEITMRYLNIKDEENIYKLIISILLIVEKYFMLNIKYNNEKVIERNLIKYEFYYKDDMNYKIIDINYKFIEKINRKIKEILENIKYQIYCPNFKYNEFYNKSIKKLREREKDYNIFIDLNIRKKSIDMLIDFVKNFKLNNRTIHLTIYIYDLYTKNIFLDKNDEDNIIILSCLQIASEFCDNFEDKITERNIKNFYQFDKKQVELLIQYRQKIISNIDFDIIIIPFDYTRICWHIHTYKNLKLFVRFLLDIIVFDGLLIKKIKPSKLTAILINEALKFYQYDILEGSILYYQVKDLQNISNSIWKIVKKVIKNNNFYIYDKYHSLISLIH